MRFAKPYRVKRGDTALSITIKYTGCPKCVRMLVTANPQKPYTKLSNGFVTFKDLQVGELLNIPQPWVDGTNKLFDKSEWPWPPGWDENWQQYYKE